jgi:hypothetical protein
MFVASAALSIVAVLAAALRAAAGGRRAIESGGHAGVVMLDHLQGYLPSPDMVSRARMKSLARSCAAGCRRALTVLALATLINGMPAQGFEPGFADRGHKARGARDAAFLLPARTKGSCDKERADDAAACTPASFAGAATRPEPPIFAATAAGGLITPLLANRETAGLLFQVLQPRNPRGPPLRHLETTTS